MTSERTATALVDPGEWTPRQRQVLDLLARGRTNPQIAETLGVSLDGAKWHVREIMAILAVDSREEAADYWRARNGWRTRLRRTVGGFTAALVARWAAGLAGAALLASVVVVAFLLANGGGQPAATPSASVTPGETPMATTTTTTTTTTPQAGYLCPFDDAALCDFAVEIAAAFHPPDYGLSGLVEGSPWSAPEFYRQLSDAVEAAFRFEGDSVRNDDEGDIHLVTIACPVAEDFARCDGPGFVLTFADLDPRSAPSTAFADASTLSLVFERPADGRPVLAGPVAAAFDPLTTIVGGIAQCDLLGLESAMSSCDGLLFRSTLVPPVSANPSELAGVLVEELRQGEPVDLPEGVVLFFNPTCYACEGGVATYRAYRSDDGLVVDELSPVASGAEGYQMARTMDASGTRMAVAMCEGEYCGGVGDPSSDAAASMWWSEDGGITWEERGDMPVWSSFQGFAGDQVMVSTWDYATATRREWLWPSGDPVPPGPVPGADRFASAPYWIAEDGISGHSRVYDGAGNLIVDRVDPRYRTSLSAIGADGRLYLAGWPLSGWAGDPTHRIVAVDGHGQPTAAYSWAPGDLRLTAPIAPGVFLGNALFDEPRVPGPAPFRPALIDLNDGTVRPIAALPPDEGTGIGGYAFTVHAITGEFVRIADSDGCASVHAQPRNDAGERGCFAPGVLLGDGSEAREEGGIAWRAVTTPSGDAGWVRASLVVVP